MKRLWYTAIFYFALCAGHAHAGDVILHMPDEQIKDAIEEICNFYHCTGTTDAEKAQQVADLIVNVVSHGSHHTLASIGGSMDVRYEQWTP